MVQKLEAKEMPVDDSTWFDRSQIDASLLFRTGCGDTGFNACLLHGQNNQRPAPLDVFLIPSYSICLSCLLLTLPVGQATGQLLVMTLANLNLLYVFHHSLS